MGKFHLPKLPNLKPKYTPEEWDEELRRMPAALRVTLENIGRDLLLEKTRGQFDISDYLFGPQLDFARDPAQYATAVCSRRAGKTVGCAALLYDCALKGQPALYFTLTRLNAKRIIWPTLVKMNTERNLGFEANESDLVMKRDGVALIHLAGADTRGEIEKWRGIGWGLAVGDEAQLLAEYLKDAVEDVLEPSLMDYGGKIRLIGTPGTAPVGYFHDCCVSDGWSHHSWTVFDNPWIKKKSGRTPQEHLANTLKRRGVTIDDPGIQREYFGRWAFDPNALVFRFDPRRDVFAGLPTYVKPWEYVIGVDLGWDDADAIAVLAFNEASPVAYCVEEWTGTKQLISALGDRLKKLEAQYNPISIVVDYGGLGKKIAEEVSARTGLPLKPAEKVRKFEYIELLNDSLRTNRFKVKPDSQFGRDAMLVEWDRERSKPDRPQVNDRKFHSDICDAVLYAFRECLHWLHVPPEERPEEGSIEAYRADAKRYEDEAVKRLEEDLREQKEALAEWTEWG